MNNRHSFLLLLTFLSAFTALQAQQYGPRVFLDLPNIYFAAPDVENVNHVLGAGLGTAINVGTHWMVARLGGGANMTIDPKPVSNADVGETFATTPYALFEAGAGMYRSNGNRCAKTHSSAFTALGKAGVRYDFYTGDTRKALDKSGEIDYTVGAELAYFFIRDIFKNYEVFVEANYLTQKEVVSANFGFKMFLNLRADRD